MFIGLAIGLPAGFVLALGYHLVRGWRRELSRRRFERLLK